MLIGDFAEILQGSMNFGKVLVVLIDHVRPAKFILACAGGIVGEVGIFVERVDRIETETCHATLVPEASGFEHGFGNFRIAPVEVRLFGIEIVGSNTVL